MKLSEVPDIEGKLIDLRRMGSILVSGRDNDFLIKEGRIRQREYRSESEVGALGAGEPAICCGKACDRTGGSSRREPVFEQFFRKGVAIVTIFREQPRYCCRNVLTGPPVLQVNLVDTAGLRETADVIEQAEIRKAMGDIRAD